VPRWYPLGSKATQVKGKMKMRMLGHVHENRTYFGTLNAAAAKELFFVSTYDAEDPESNAADKHGYQRPPTAERYQAIANYFATNGNIYLITPILVSVRLDEGDVERFIKLFDAGDTNALKKVFGDKIMSVVDGQHRFQGLVKAWEDNPTFLPEIPVMFYFCLDFVEEAELFNIVNVTQRKLPKALIETTRGDITEVGDASYSQRVRRISFSLCRDEDSVWGPVDGAEQINMTGVRDPGRKVTYEGLRRSTSNMYPKPLMDRLLAIDEDLPVKYAKRFWKAVSEACSEAWNGDPSTRTITDLDTEKQREEKILYRIKDLVGVASLAKLGSDIVKDQIQATDPDLLENTVAKLVEVDWEKNPTNPWMRSQAGFAGQKELYEVLYAFVYSDIRPGEAESVL
jgi:DGQHR domain-containing protein